MCLMQDGHAHDNFRAISTCNKEKYALEAQTVSDPSSLLVVVVVLCQTG